MFKKTMIVSAVIVLLAVPLAKAEITFFNNSNDFFQSTNIIHTEIFENSDDGFFPAQFDSFIYDGEGKIGHTTWSIDNAPGFNIPISSFVLYSPAVGIDFLKLKSPFSAIGFDFAAPYNPETIGNTIYIEVTEIDNQLTTYEYVQKDDPNGVWEYYGFVSSVGISQIKVYNDETDGILDDNFVFDNVSNSAIVPIEDTDGDGISGDEDACPNSDLNSTVIIDGCDSGVDNMLFDDGCTISDLIYQCADNASNHGQFTSGVSHMTNYLKKDGTISGKEKGKIQGCAASARIP